MDIESHARDQLGARLVGTYPDAEALFRSFGADLSVVSLEPRTAPPVIADLFARRQPRARRETRLPAVGRVR